MTDPLYFQWQNEILRKSIYPMREAKLRDFLVYYQEVDLWAEYKNKDITGEIKAYQDAKRLAAITAFKTYSTKRSYFMRPDVRADYFRFRPIDEAELTAINNLHNTFISSWPKDVRGERDFVTGQVAAWEQHRKLVADDIKSRERRHAAMDPNHPRYAPEGQELQVKKTVTLPMADQELDQLYAFLATYDKIEQRKLEWYQLTKKDPNFSVPEADFLVQVPTDKPPTPQEIVAWKVEDYQASLKDLDQYQLLELIRQRFLKDPKRYPTWLQYMTVHFSGMRYASAHSSWADPKDLIIRIRTPDVQKKVKAMDDAAVTQMCQQKVAAYEATNGTAKPPLALTQDKDQKYTLGYNLANIKAPGPQTRRVGLTALLVQEMAYDIKSWPTEQALQEIRNLKATFPAWAWKVIIKLTPLRVTEVTDPAWEALTPDEESQRYLPQNTAMNMLISAWENFDPSAWREEHGRSHELIVSRAVCNETAEHLQHIRGHLPPGGLTPKPTWYLTNETQNALPGTPRPYFVKPASEQDYTPGASILWLRFVDTEPNDWQIAKSIQTKTKDGLIPADFINRKPGAKTASSWVYRQGDIVMRTRSLLNDKKQKVNQQQWLRWFHEATVAEVAETADGKMILTYETALPDDPRGTSCIGLFKKPLYWFLSDGTEDQYNRSFVGYVPEGQVPVEHMKLMLDWNKILRKQVA